MLFYISREATGEHQKSCVFNCSNLKTYIRSCFVRLWAVSCIVDDFVKEQFEKMHPEKNDDRCTKKKPMFPLGTTIMTFGKGGLESLNYFLSESIRGQSEIFH